MENDLLTIAASLETMNPENGLNLTRNVILWSGIGVLVLGILGVTAQFFASKYRDQLDSNNQEMQAARLEELATSVPAQTAELVVQKVMELRLIEVEQGDLRSKYPLGYGILSFDGDDWFALPRSTDFNWDTVRMKLVDGDKISLRLPDYDDGDAELRGNALIIDREAGVEYPVAHFGLNMLVRVLKSDAKSLQILIATIGKPPPGIWSRNNLTIGESPTRLFTQLLIGAENEVSVSDGLSDEEKTNLIMLLRLGAGHLAVTNAPQPMLGSLSQVRDELIAVGGAALTLVNQLDKLAASIKAESSQPDAGAEPEDSAEPDVADDNSKN